MRYMTEKEYDVRLKQIEHKNKSRERKQKLEELDKKFKSKSKLPATSKLMAFYLFVLLNVVLTYSMVSMWHFSDLSYLGALITDVAAQVLTYFIYARKATAENTQGGITYDMAMKSINETPICNVNEIGNVEINVDENSVG